MGFRRTGNGEILAINALISFPSKIHSERVSSVGELRDIS